MRWNFNLFYNIDFGKFENIYYFPLISKSCVCKSFCFSAALRAQGFKALGDISQKVRQESLHCRLLTRRNKRSFRKM